MTFVGIHCRTNSADLVVDEGSYEPPYATIFRRSTKAVLLPHLDAAFATSGNGLFAASVRETAHLAGDNVEDFDDLIDQSPKWVAEAVASTGLNPEDSASGAGGTLYLVGYSNRAQSFTAYTLRMNDPTPVEVKGALVSPAPWTLRPSQRQCEEVLRAAGAMGLSADEVDDLRRGWMAKPRAKVFEPTDWVKLATEARRSRSAGGTTLRVWVTGRLFLTRLEKGTSTTRVLHEFNDTGDELRSMLAGTLHPVGQWLPCAYCDSGLPGLDCCMSDMLAEPCRCGSGTEFQHCCMVDRDAIVPESLWTKPYLEL